MATSIATALAGGPAEDAGAELGQILQRGLRGEEPKAVLVFTSSRQPLSSVLARLRQTFPASIVAGASSAGAFEGSQVSKDSACAFAVAGELEVTAGMSRGLTADAERAMRYALEPSLPIAGFGYRTALVLLSAPHGGPALAVVQRLLAGNVRLVGAEAGDELGLMRTEVGLSEAAGDDSAVVVMFHTHAPLGIGVCHAHEPIGPPMTVTRADGALVHELDGRPAWEVWLQAVQQAARREVVTPNSLSPREVWGFLLQYQAGLDSGRTELRMRTPLDRTEAGGLIFASEVPLGSIVRVTDSRRERQLRSAEHAARRASMQLSGAPVAGALVVDCMYRSQLVGGDFGRALAAVSPVFGGAPVLGFAARTQIAMVPGDLSGVQNSTTVVLAFPVQDGESGAQRKP